MKQSMWMMIVLLLASYLPGIPLFDKSNLVNASSYASSMYTPTDLRMAPASNTDASVVLVWEKPLYYSNIVRYNIYNLDGTLVGSTDKTFYKVLGLNPETSYGYLVRAQDANGNESLDSNTIQITTKRTGKRFNVKDYGAVGDGSTLDTAAIQSAIDAVTPGDTLYFPAGSYVTGGIFLHSNMTVYVDAGAAIMPSTKKADFMPFVLQRHSLEEPEAYQSLINAGVLDHTNYGYSVENIAILGPGTIGDEENGLLLREEYDKDVDEVGHSYGGGHLIGLSNAHNVYLDGLRIRNGMMWTIVPVYSKDITAYNLDVNTSQHNGDGFDPNSSESVYILNSTFQTGDDSSAIKSGINEEGRQIGRPSRFIYYRGDTFSGGHGGIVIGSEMSGGVSDVYAEDCNLIPVDVSSNAASPGFKVKTSTSRGGYIKNIQVRDSLINKIDLNSNYDKLDVPDIYPPDMSNFRFINLVNNDTAGTAADNVISLTGAPSTPTSDNTLKNVQFINVAFTKAILTNTENIFFKDSRLTQGINLTKSSNIVQDGEVVYDKSFPVNEDFSDYQVGDSPGGYWTPSTTNSNLGSIDIVSDGASGPNSMYLNDRGAGYVTAQRSFAPQTGTTSVEVSMKFLTPQNVSNGVPTGTYATKVTGNNRVFQLLSSNGKIVLWLNTENSGALSYVINGQTSQTIIPLIPLDTWFSLKTVVDYNNKLVDVYYNGNKVLSGQPFYDSTLATPDISTFKSVGPNNNTTVASQVMLDDLKVHSDSAEDTGYGIVIQPSNGKSSITEKGGSLSFSAAKTTGGASSVTWAVYNTDLTPTSHAAIDANGVLTAKQDGQVLVTASMNDGSAILGMYPVTITGQESVIGFKPLQVTTAVGAAPILPAQVPVMLDNGSVDYAPVIWDFMDSSKFAQPGTVTIYGTVTGYAQRAAITVHVTSVVINSYLPVIVKTTAGAAPQLPNQVKAVLNNLTTQSLPVVWDDISPGLYAHTNVSGFKVTGTVQGAELPVTAYISVLPDVASGAKQFILVAADGSGDYRTIQEAIHAVPDQNDGRAVIFVKNGLYYEKVLIPESKPYISMIGESEDGVILTYDDSPKKTSANGSSLGLGTYTDYTLMIKGHDFYGKNLTIRNTSGSGSGQSVALDIYADKVMFENSRITAYQDTLLTRNLTDNADPLNYANNTTIQSYRSYFKDCYISGSVDFIFGPGIAVFDHTELRSRLTGHVTAASTPLGQKFGYVFLDSKVTGEPLINGKNGVDLGRPWRPYAKTVYLNSYIGAHIAATGWNNFGNASNERTAYYGEYNSYGPGANPTARLSWTHQLTSEEASDYTLANIFSKSSTINGTDDWDPEAITSIPSIQTTTPLGTAPLLPSVVDAVYANGTTTQVSVVWDPIAPEQYAQNGTFTVTGSVYGSSLNATALVTVRAGSVLTGPQRVNAGQSLELVYGFSGVTQSVYGMDLTFTYPSEHMQFVSAESLVDGVSVIHHVTTPGQVRILIASSSPDQSLTGSLSRILQLQFMIDSSAQATTSTINLSKVWVSDGSGNEIAVDGTSYEVAVEAFEAADMTTLITKLNEANSRAAAATIGTYWGQYTQDAVNRLHDAITKALAVKNDTSSAQSAVDQEVQSLSAAIQAFDASMNTNAGVIDLQIIDQHYGVTSTSNDWSSVKRYDLNQDHQLNIVDLVLMARKIVISRS
ncbi:pectinesterase family protein [Paenibacillus hexagrammi]|uniref:Probable pectate lyase C n=1 Tax=Paenibacillus hexagrammi TaxID=2908839 RepID=A0ABY3SSJ5_9BACL|nr:pectinesterase family protein [Paenibacillus sp. YPD9-1]UJF36403.1 pectinesterase family protein [Paenibacillus sp. YPD9-1]